MEQRPQACVATRSITFLTMQAAGRNNQTPGPMSPVTDESTPLCGHGPPNPQILVPPIFRIPAAITSWQLQCNYCVILPPLPVLCRRMPCPQCATGCPRLHSLEGPLGHSCGVAPGLVRFSVRSDVGLRQIAPPMGTLAMDNGQTKSDV